MSATAKTGGGMSSKGRRWRLMVCAWAALLAPLPGVASESQGAPAASALDLTLQDAVVLALRNSRSLTNARLSRAVERYALRIAKQEFRPQLTLGAYSDRDVGDTTTETSGILSAVRLRIPTGGELSLASRVADLDPEPGGGASHSSVIDLTFTQPLLRGAGFAVGGARLRTAKTAEEINILAFRASIIDLTTGVIRAYRAYIQAGRRDEIALQSLERARELLRVNRLLVQTGRMAERDVIQTEADIARRELDAIASQGGLDAARLILIDILDLDTETRFGKTDVLDPGQVEKVALDAEAGIATAFANRPDYLGALLGLRNAETQALVAKNDRWWDLSLTLGTSFTGADNSYADALGELDRQGHRVALDLSIPVGPAASGPAELAWRRAEAFVAMSRNNLDDLRQRIDIEVRNAVRNVNLALRQADLARKARELAQQKAEIERQKLSLGVSTNFQLVAFENDLVLAENAELDAAVGYLNAVTELDRTLGTTLGRWGIDIDRVEHSVADSERFGVADGVR